MSGGNGPGNLGHPSGQEYNQGEVVAVDPSIAPGLQRPEGWRVLLGTGLGAWDKTGPLDTDWTVVGVSSTAVNVGAEWTLGRCRVYAIDTTNGNDANAGFADPASTSAADYAIACAAAGAVARKTSAGLAAVLPKIGNGRKVEIVIAAGSYVGDAVDLGALLRGLEGYIDPTIRGTSTNATAGAVAFAGTTQDATYAGAVTATGMNAAGYNPTGAPTTSVIQCLKVGGAAPAFGAEPAIPDGWRIRFDSASTTAALRNICRQVCRVSGTDTVYTQTALPAVPVAGDTFYLEQAGVVVDAYTLNAPPNGGNGVQIVGVVTAGAVLINDARARLTLCGGSALNANGNQLDVVATPQAYTHPVLGSLTAGGGFRATGASSFGSVMANLNGFVCVNDLTLAGTLGVLQWGAGAAARSVTVSNAPMGSGTTTTPNIGTTAAVGIPRIFGGGGVGLNLTGVNIQLGAMNIDGVGANPAIKLRGQDVVVFSGIVTGTTGNTDVGLDLTAAAGCIIFLSATPTVTGGAGNVRLAGGQIITWAQALAGIVDSAGNRIIGTDTALIGQKFVGALFGGAGAALSYAADTSPALLLVNEVIPVRYPTSIGLRVRLRVLVLVLSTNTINNTITLFKNGVATAMTVTVPATTAAGTLFTDSAHPIMFADGDDFALQAANAGADAGKALIFAAFLEQPG